MLPDVSVGRERGGVNKKEKEMTIDELAYQLKHNWEALNVPKKRREIEAEIHKKISFSFATVVFVLVGLPTAIISRRGEIVVGFTIAIAVVAVYYILFVLGRAMAINGTLPAWVALWLPNAMMLALAAFLGKRMVQL